MLGRARTDSRTHWKSLRTSREKSPRRRPTGPARRPYATSVAATLSGLGILVFALCLAIAPPASAQVISEPTLPYDRSLYKHWTDHDGDCQDTRQEVLIAESLRPVELDDVGCTVLSGRWRDPYTGFVYSDPSELDIDHLVPLAEAHRSGAHAWDLNMRTEFANDLLRADGLVAVSASVNRSKGDKDPAQWLPPNESFRCEYVRKWVINKFVWGLSMDPTEEHAVRALLQACRNPRDSHGPPNPGEVVAEPGLPSANEGEDGCQDINQADVEALQAVSGIGPAKAQAIVDYIEQHGPFERLEDVVRVDGIGAASLENIRSAGYCVAQPATGRQDSATSDVKRM